MRTSLIEIAQIEAFLSGKLEPVESLLFEANQLTDPVLNKKVRFQKALYQLVRLFGRDELRAELEQIHSALLKNPEKRDFQKEITEIFKKN